jgi:hypothetical protein
MGSPLSLDDYFDEVINFAQTDGRVRRMELAAFWKWTRFMPTARYFRDMAAVYREIARRMRDPYAADSMSAIAARHQERADELERWSGSSVRTPITPIYAPHSTGQTAPFP